jgi:antitoxin component of MazEF toxin-antitoxin module
MPFFTVVQAYRIREHGSMVAVIPKVFLDELRIEKGTKLRVWKDNKNRLIYEPQLDRQIGTDNTA